MRHDAAARRPRHCAPAPARCADCPRAYWRWRHGRTRHRQPAQVRAFARARSLLPRGFRRAPDVSAPRRDLLTPNFNTYKLAADPLFQLAAQAEIPGGGTRATNKCVSAVPPRCACALRPRTKRARQPRPSINFARIRQKRAVCEAHAPRMRSESGGLTREARPALGVQTNRGRH